MLQYSITPDDVTTMAPELKQGLAAAIAPFKRVADTVTGTAQQQLQQQLRQPASIRHRRAYSEAAPATRPPARMSSASVPAGTVTPSESGDQVPEVAAATGLAPAVPGSGALRRGLSASASASVSGSPTSAQVVPIPVDELQIPETVDDEAAVDVSRDDDDLPACVTAAFADEETPLFTLADLGTSSCLFVSPSAQRCSACQRRVAPRCVSCVFLTTCLTLLLLLLPVAGR